MKALRALCLAAALIPSLASAQVYLPPGVGLPPRSVIGNTLPQAGDAVAVSFAQLSAGLNVPALKTCSTSNWFSSLTAGGVLGCTQPQVSDIAGFGSGVATFLGTPTSANLRAAVTDETGSGSLVFATNPSLINPALGTPSAIVLTNATSLPVSTGLSGLGTGVATALGANVGSGGSVVTNGGALGTPSSGIATNLTGVNATNISTGTLNSARLAYNGAVLQAIPTNPTGTTSATFVMMGLGVTTCRFTPAFSTRVKFQINGSVANTTVNGISTFSLRYGTGAGPANGAAGTGTSPSNSQSVTSSTANAQVAFLVDGLVTGLSAGTTYWFDTTLSASAGTSAILSLNCSAFEF